MSHPLLDQMDRLIDLIDKVDNSSIDQPFRDDIKKYLRWAIQETAKTVWREINREVETVSVWDNVAKKFMDDNGL